MRPGDDLPQPRPQLAGRTTSDLRCCWLRSLLRQPWQGTSTVVSGHVLAFDFETRRGPLHLAIGLRDPHLAAVACISRLSSDSRPSFVAAWTVELVRRRGVLAWPQHNDRSGAVSYHGWVRPRARRAIVGPPDSCIRQLAICTLTLNFDARASTLPLRIA